MSSKVAAGKYTRVGEKKGPLVIRGAEKKMADDPTFIYVPMFRVAGPEKEVVSWLRENKSGEEKSALKSCYSVSNLKNKTIRGAFEREVEYAQEERAAALSSKNEIRKVNLMVLVKLLKIFDEQRKASENNPAQVVHKTTLKEKVKHLSTENKVLDVTSMKQRGTDSKKISFKEGGNKRRLSQEKTDPFYSVVYNSTSPFLFNFSVVLNAFLIKVTALALSLALTVLSFIL